MEENLPPAIKDCVDSSPLNQISEGERNAPARVEMVIEEGKESNGATGADDQGNGETTSDVEHDDSFYDAGDVQEKDYNNSQGRRTKSRRSYS
jgi:hypothetical protein